MPGFDIKEGSIVTTDLKPEKNRPVFFGKGMIAIIIGIVVVLVAVLAVSLMQAGPGAVLSPSACGEKVRAYVNNNLIQQGTSVELLSTRENRGIYELKIRYLSQEETLYATKDCNLLFLSSLNMTAGSGVQQTPSVTQVPVKSERPVVDLYVMAFCPYGTQAETVMSPVVDLLASKADIRVRYITTVTGDTAGSVDSLHGPAEAKEDLGQICINKYYPDKYWSYIRTFNEQCYPSWQDAAALASCRKNITASLSMNRTKIDACAQGAEGLALLKADETAGEKDNAYSSPTLVINGVRYSGPRNPDAYKQAICNSFETVPSECSTVLSSVSAAASGAC
jgi:hypothetical protein